MDGSPALSMVQQQPTGMQQPTGGAPVALTPANMQYNANQANQASMNTINNNSAFDPNSYQQFKNPYIQDVVNANTEQSWRNFNQQQAPALQSQFGGAGQFGSARGMAMMEQASRDNAMQTNWQNAQLLQSGYNKAMDLTQNQQAQNINAANAMNQAGATGQSMSNQQTLTPYQIQAMMNQAGAALKPQTGTTSNGASVEGLV